MRISKSMQAQIRLFSGSATVDPVAATELGLKQFLDKESLGLEPTDPDPYYLFLIGGKKWWEWTVNQYAELYGKPEWPGWYCLALDWLGEPHGFRQIRQRCGVIPIDPEDIVNELLLEGEFLLGTGI